MNKFTKGAIATGAGVVLLLGGAGTFALWNDSADTAAGTINAGTLTIDAADNGQWADISTDSVHTAPGHINPADFLVVPGDTLTFTQSFTVVANGDNLVADIDVNVDEITNDAWGDDLAVTYVATLAGSDVTSVSSSDDDQTLTVVVKVVFPVGGIGDNDAKGTPGNVDLTGLKISLTQSR